MKTLTYGGRMDATQSTEPKKPTKKLNLTPASEIAPPHTSAGVVVLQWLSYAFWGWLIVGLVWVLSAILMNALLDSDVTSTIPYALAAAIVLLPVAFVTDLFYRKHETVKKHGAGMVIMVVHAVLFALFAIGSLVVTVFTGLNLILTLPTEATSATVILLTGLFATIAYGLTFLRVLHPFKTKRFARWFGIGMLILTLVFVVLAIVGPILKSVASRDDRLIESGLSSVSNAINKYARTNDALPATLNELTIKSADAQQLISRGLVTYTAEGEHVEDSEYNTSKSYRYQLCVTYTSASEYNSYSYSDYDDYADTYQTTPSTYQHDAGKTCYKLESYDY